MLNFTTEHEQTLLSYDDKIPFIFIKFQNKISLRVSVSRSRS